MGAASSIVSKPEDASDITDIEAAKAEIVSLRALVRKHAPANVTMANYPNITFPPDKATHPNFPKLQYQTCMSRVLTPEIYAELRDKVSKSGYTFDMALQCGCDSPGQTGFAVPDVESYVLWKKLVDPILNLRHRKPDGTGFQVGVDKHSRDLDTSKITPKLDAETINKYVRSTRVRCARNVAAFPNPCAISRAERREISGLVKAASATLTGDLEGSFFDLGALTDAETKQLREDRMLFQRPGLTNMNAPSGGIRDWPDGRAVFHSKDKKFIIWCNEEDQMRLISMQMGGDIIEIFDRFVRGVNAIETHIKAAGHDFKFHEDVGFIGSCPSNWGTGMRSSMMIKIPKLIEKFGEDKMRQLANGMGMGLRGGRGEHSAIEGGLCELSNFCKIGMSEVQLIQTMVDGVANTINWEIALEAGKDIDAEVAKIDVSSIPLGDSSSHSK